MPRTDPDAGSVQSRHQRSKTTQPAGKYDEQRRGGNQDTRSAPNCQQSGDLVSQRGNGDPEASGEEKIGLRSHSTDAQKGCKDQRRDRGTRQRRQSGRDAGRVLRSEDGEKIPASKACCDQAQQQRCSQNCRRSDQVVERQRRPSIPIGLPPRALVQRCLQ
jgi:hypothetical protein